MAQAPLAGSGVVVPPPLGGPPGPPGMALPLTASSPPPPAFRPVSLRPTVLPPGPTVVPPRIGSATVPNGGPLAAVRPARRRYKLGSAQALLAMADAAVAALKDIEP